ncbi:hypothetical protein [Planococcus donghaensis]|uniref:Uncharacterized protein n=1 Tax=Planococcus donghaensis TaxID=414778 RepID=A0A1C7EF78_9BACL|nr:hypothetical protein [Planococcus donghaensis]ANU22500.1 hypothetical protein BCM40_03640 [Planococcus donghaensis]
MQIDFKYILRYGLPGWFLCITLITNFCLINNIGFTMLFSGEYAAILSMLAGLLIFGVPIGYVLNRLGVFLWVCKVKEKEYFKAEMAVDEVLKKDDFLRARYRYLLTVLNGAQTLCIAATFAFILNMGVTAYGFFMLANTIENGYETEIIEETTTTTLLTETVDSGEIITTTETTSTEPVVKTVSLSEFEKDINEIFMGISVILCLVLLSSIFIFYSTAEYHERYLDCFIEYNVLKTRPTYVNTTTIQKARVGMDKLFLALSKMFSSK